MLPFDLGLTCVTLLATAPLLATIWAIVRRGNLGAGTLVTVGALTASLAIASLVGPELPITWSISALSSPLISAETPTQLTLNVRLDSTGGIMLAALGIAAICLGWTTNHSASGLSRTLTLCLFNTAVWFWLLDTVWVALVLQGISLGLGFLLIAAQPRWPAAGPAARALWLTVTCTDIALLLVAFGWNLEAGASTFSGAGSAAAIANVAARSSAAVAALGTLLWLGTLGRMLQFPFGMTCDQSRHSGGLPFGAVVVFALTTVGWRWLATAQLWFHSSPQPRDLVCAGSALGGAGAAWFAICSNDPRSRMAWLTTVPWSFATATMLADDSSGTWTSLLIGITGLIGAAWLFGLWESESSTDENLNAVDAAAENTTVFSFAALAGGRTVTSQFTGPAQQAFRIFTGDTEADRGSSTSAVTARGGRPAVLVGCIGLLLAPLLLGQSGDIGDVIDASNSSAAIGEVTPETQEHSHPAARSRWPRWMRYGVLGLATLAATLLVAETRPTPQLYFPIWMLAVGGALIFVPWVIFGAPEFNDPRQRLMEFSESIRVSLLAVTCGALVGIYECRRRTDAPQRGWLEPWSRLGRRRLYLNQIILFGFNLPIRGLAQLTRFFDWFVWEQLVLGMIAQLPRLGIDAEVDLHRSEPGFYALSLCLGATVVALTLMWLGQ